MVLCSGNCRGIVIQSYRQRNMFDFVKLPQLKIASLNAMAQTIPETDNAQKFFASVHFILQMLAIFSANVQHLGKVLFQDFIHFRVWSTQETIETLPNQHTDLIECTSFHANLIIGNSYPSNANIADENEKNRKKTWDKVMMNKFFMLFPVTWEEQENFCRVNRRSIYTF